MRIFNKIWCSYSIPLKTLTKMTYFLLPVTLKFYIWHWKTIGHLFYNNSSFMHSFIAIGRFRFELQSGCSNWVKFDDFLPPMTSKFLWMTLKINRAPLLCPFMLYASFLNHQWKPVWVTVRKQVNWFLNSVTLTFVLWLDHLHRHHFCQG